MANYIEDDVLFALEDGMTVIIAPRHARACYGQFWNDPVSGFIASRVRGVEELPGDEYARYDIDDFIRRLLGPEYPRFSDWNTRSKKFVRGLATRIQYPRDEDNNRVQCALQNSRSVIAALVRMSSPKPTCQFNPLLVRQSLRVFALYYCRPGFVLEESTLGLLSRIVVDAVVQWNVFVERNNPRARPRLLEVVET
jgi:hypothetical protein